MAQQPYQLDQESRASVLAVMRHHCEYRGWNLLAAHVRMSHVHVVVEAQVRPERVMHEFKSYSSRELNRLDRDGPDRKRWTRHGSTRWLWNDKDVQQAVRYVIDGQGPPMALFVADNV
jgi:REP element-mobilizing transposase RayT